MTLKWRRLIVVPFNIEKVEELKVLVSKSNMKNNNKVVVLGFLVHVCK
jgi:hypothetical protein